MIFLFSMNNVSGVWFDELDPVISVYVYSKYLLKIFEIT